MKKKVLFSVFAILTAVSLASCHNSPTEDNSDPITSSTTVEPTSSSTTAPTESSTIEPTSSTTETSVSDEFGEITYVWSTDFKCTATKPCLNDSSKSITETVAGVYTKLTDATCEAGEAGKYVASFTNTIFTEQEKKVTLNNAKGHNYAISYEWDGNKCTGTRVCLNDATDVTTETVDGIYSKLTDATCEAGEAGKYVAEFNCKAFETQEKEVTLNNAKGHNYNVTYSWDANYNCVAIFTCINDSTHTQTVNCTVTYEDTALPSCSEDGVRIYIATASFNNRMYYQTKEAAISATGHSYTTNVNYVWDDDYNCAATIVCDNDPTHTITEAVEGIYTQEVAGNCSQYEEGYYTAEFTNSLFETQTKDFLATEYSDHDYVDGECIYCHEIIMSNELQFEYNSGTYYITGYTGTDKVLNILPTYDNGINGVAPVGFKGGDSTFVSPFVGVEIINIYADIETIPNYAFANCTALKEINLPESLLVIGEYAFFNCTHLQNFDALDTKLTSIGTRAFYKCSNMEKMLLPKSATTFNQGIFQDCSSLEEYQGPRAGYGSNTSTAYFGLLFTYTETPYVDPENTYGYVPSTLKKVTITGKYVADYAFYKCSHIEELYFTEDETAIYDYAFNKCTGLKKVVFAGVDNKIYSHAFGDCSNMKYFECNGLALIEEYALRYCSSIEEFYIQNTEALYNGITTPFLSKLSKISLGSNLKAIPNGLLNNVASVQIINTSFTNVETIGEYAFAGTNIAEFDFSNTKTIGAYAFANCSSLANVNLSNVEVVNEYAFNNCTSIDSMILSNAQYIYKHAFDGCTTASKLEFSNNISYIGESAFNSCSSLLNIEIPDGNGDISICKNAFMNCSNAEYLTIGKNVKLIQAGAFKDLESLISISYKATDASATAQDFSPFNNSGKSNACELFVANSVTSIPDSLFSFSNINSIVFEEESSLITIGEFAFMDSAIASIIIPNSVEEIGNNAFNNCGRITSITIGTNVKRIGEKAFCSNIAAPLYYNAISAESTGKLNIFEGVTGKLYIGENVTDIPDFIFDSSAFESIEFLGNNVKKIGMCSFQNMLYITTVDIPESVEDIGYSAFAYMPSLEKIYFNAKNVTSCDTNVFLAKDSKKIVVEIGENVTNIPNKIFAASNVKEIVFANSNKLTKIGSNAFDGCSYLEEINIPNSVSTIGDYAFSSSGLNSINISNNVTAIGNNAFSNTSLKNVYYDSCVSPKALFTNSTINTFTYGENLTEIINPGVKITHLLFSENLKATAIPAEAFKNATNISAFEVPASVTEIGDSAFEGASITSLVIGNNVETIGNKAFYNCTEITSLYFDTNATFGLDVFDSLGKTKGCALTIGKNVTAINNSQFSNVQNKSVVNSITFESDSSLQEIGSYAFERQAISGALVFPESLKTINGLAFSSNAGITSIDFKNVETLKANCFQGCTGLTSVTLPESLIYISSPFINSSNIKTINYNCIEVTSNFASIPASVEVINIGENVKVIPENLAADTYGNSLLNTINFSNSLNLENIKYRAFYGNKNLQSVVIPSSLTKMGDQVFMECKNLAYVINLSQLNITIGATTNGYAAYYAKYLFTEMVDLSTIKSEKVSGLTYTIIGDICYLESIGTAKQITVPESVTFTDGTTFTGITLSNGIFSNNISITKVILPDNVLGSFDHLFDGCSELLEVHLPENLTKIAPYMFYNCKKLCKLNLPSTVTEIGDYAFFNTYASNWEKFDIPKTIKKFGNMALKSAQFVDKFYYSSSQTFGISPLEYAPINELIICNDVETIPASIFSTYNLTSSSGYAARITKISFENNSICKSIASCAFKGTSLKEVELPSSITSIGTQAFALCSTITKIEYNCINATAGTVDNPIFYCKTSSSNNFNINIYIGAEVNNIPSYLFYYIPGINSITYLGNQNITVGQCAFDAYNGNANSKAKVSVKYINWNGTMDEYLSAITYHADNGGIADAKVSLYSENTPAEAGYYWHYDENNLPAQYTFEPVFESTVESFEYSLATELNTLVDATYNNVSVEGVFTFTLENAEVTNVQAGENTYTYTFTPANEYFTPITGEIVILGASE